MFVDIEQLSAFHLALGDPAWDPGLEQYRDHLVKLNKIVTDFGEPFEGGLFYPHLSVELSDTPAELTLNKRRNFAIFSMAGDSMLEIGFNAGHSCLLAMTMNPSLIYTGVDIAVHPYTRPCYAYLQSVFPGRMQVHFGDSRDVLPVLRGGRGSTSSTSTAVTA